MIGFRRNIVPSERRYSLHTSFASSTSTSFGMCAASDAPSFTYSSLASGLGHTGVALRGDVHPAPAAGCTIVTIPVDYSASAATGRSRIANRHREPSFASGLDPSPRVAAGWGSDGVWFLPRG